MRQPTYLVILLTVCLLVLFYVFVISSESFAPGNKQSQKRARTKYLSKIPLYAGVKIADVPMYLINLDKRTDRLKTTIRLLNDKGYTHVERFSAIDSTTKWDHVKQFVSPDAVDSIIKGYRTEHHQLSKGAIGCYLSHYELWKKAAEDDTNIIIFEDDTYPTLSYVELKKYLGHVPGTWDLILFGGVYNTQSNIINQYVSKLSRFYCLHAYMISSKACKFLISRALPITQQVDSFLSDLSEENYLDVYGLRNTGWVQNPEVNSTNIQTPMYNDDVAPIDEIVQQY